MRRLLYLVLVLAVIGLAADVAARQYVEARVENEAEARSGAQARAQARLSAFPFIPRVLSGRAGGIDVTVTDFQAGALRLSSLEVELGDVRLDEQRLLEDREVVVTRIRDATIAAELSADALAEATGLPLTIEGGRVAVTVADRPVPVTPRLDAGGALRIGGVALPARVLRLEAAGLVGCTETSVEVAGDRLRVSCTTEEVPPIVLRAAQRELGLGAGAPAGPGAVVPGARNARGWSE